MERHERLRLARIHGGYRSAAEAARRLDTAIGTYGGHESGTRGIRHDDIERYAKAFSVNAAWLAFGDGEMAAGAPLTSSVEVKPSRVSDVRPAPDAPPLSSLRGHGRSIPILGIAVGGEDADFHLNGETVDFVVRPPGLLNAKDVYALYVANDSMYPRFDPGQIFYVNPHRAPAIGDDVVVELNSRVEGEAGPAYLKRLKARGSSKIVVEQFNPPKEIEFDRALVKAIHRVVPWAEALGI